MGQREDSVREDLAGQRIVFQSEQRSVHYTAAKQRLICTGSLEFSYGFIKGAMCDDEFFVREFLVQPHLRRQGYGRRLARYLPNKAVLLAQPLVNGSGPHIPTASLIKFYESVQFRLVIDGYGNTVLRRGAPGPAH